MIGERLGKWIIEREVGRGGMGHVYLARDESSGLRAAIKVLVPELAQEQGFLDRFGREIEALSTLDHPNIVKFYEAGDQDGTYYYAMEFVEGEDFEKILTRVSKLPWKEVLDIALQICPALKHAHDHGIIHRDLKPHNLLRSEAGVVKLSDFGIARVFASRQLTQTGGVVGTADYLSPEQALGKTATKKSDLYSLGVVLYRMTTGWTPFHGASSAELLHKHVYGQFDRPNKRVPEMPRELDEIICQLLEKDPAKRPADALVLYRELERIRNKMDRRALQTEVYSPEQLTVAEDGVHKRKLRGPGTGTVMSRLMRKELEDQAGGGPLARWLNQPIVLGPLFVVVVGILLWTFWPRRPADPETLFAKGSALMQEDDPAAWDQAWQAYLEPLVRTYPDHPLRQEAEELHRRADGRRLIHKRLGLARVSAGRSGSVY